MTDRDISWKADAILAFLILQEGRLNYVLLIWLLLRIKNSRYLKHTNRYFRVVALKGGCLRTDVFGDDRIVYTDSTDPNKLVRRF
jgi:hypothetical protein